MSRFSIDTCCHVSNQKAHILIEGTHLTIKEAHLLIEETHLSVDGAYHNLQHAIRHDILVANLLRVHEHLPRIEQPHPVTRHASFPLTHKSPAKDAISRFSRNARGSAPWQQECIVGARMYCGCIHTKKRQATRFCAPESRISALWTVPLNPEHPQFERASGGDEGRGRGAVSPDVRNRRIARPSPQELTARIQPQLESDVWPRRSTSSLCWPRW